MSRAGDKIFFYVIQLLVAHFSSTIVYSVFDEIISQGRATCFPPRDQQLQTPEGLRSGASTRKANRGESEGSMRFGSR